MKNMASRCTWMVLLGVVLFCSGVAAAQETPQEDRPVVTEDRPAPTVQEAPPADPAQPPVTEPTDTETPALTEEPGEEPQRDPFNWRILMLIAAMFLVFIWLGRRPKKEEQRRKEMLSNLKKGDKITTIGGIVGTVLEIKEDEITVKVDEASNTRMRFARWAVRAVGPVKEENK